MGNTLGRKKTKTIKVMKIDGETFKLKAPIKAGEVLKNNPGLVLLDSEAVKHYGVRAKPLGEDKDLQPKRLYFLVELPKEANPRRVRSGINMSAKDRLESLMLSRRSASDLTILKQRNMGAETSIGGKENGGLRLKMKLPRAEVERLMKESKDEAEAAERIMNLCMARNRDAKGENGEENVAEQRVAMMEKQVHWNGGNGARARENGKAREKRVSFMPIIEGGSQIAVAS